MSYRGDVALGSTIDLKFTSRSFTTGVPTALSGGTVVAYIGNDVTEITAGITLSASFDGVVGLNNVRVVATSGNGYTTGTNVELVISAGTVGGVSVAGEVIGSFSIEARSALRPTTAGNTLDVTATGGAGVDWGNVENKTTTNALTGTTIAATQQVDLNTIKTQTVTCAAGVTVNVNIGTTQPVNFTGTGASALVKGDAIDWNSVAVTGMPMPTYTQPTGFLAATFPVTVASTTNITAGTITTISGNVNGTVGSIVSPGNVWDVVLASHITAGSTGFALNAAGSAGDPWGTLLPGGYTAGMAGWILGQQLGASFTTGSSSIFSTAALANAPTGGSAPTAAQNADALLARNIGGGSSSGRTVSQALFVLRNKVDLATTPGTMLVYSTDDTTLSWSATLTSDATADPITAVDPG